MSWIERLFSTNEFMPHGMCYEWDPRVIWLHVLSDGFIALAYFSIPITLIYFVKKRQDLAFDWIFVCFAVFIVACGTTHLMEIVSIWHPFYWLAGVIKAVTAITSIITAILLVRLIPGALAIPSPEALRQSNKALQRESEERLQATKKVEALNGQLREQTIEVQGKNRELESFVEREQELRRLAEAAERAKGEFLAIMSHEIRTPMNGVIGMTSILAETELTPMQAEYVGIINTSGEALLEVINDILDFSKVTSGKMLLEKRRFNLQECLEDALDLFGAQIRVKGIEGVYFMAPDVPLHLLGDALRLRQILVNLIGNALKFTPQGEIVIEARLEKRSLKDCCVRFSVTDTGIGIAADHVENLFRAFQQVDTSTTRKYGGTGLGLAISKNLAELMGGKMWVESELNVGSTFFFTAVFEVLAGTEPEPEDSRAKETLRTLSVLVVDDNATNRRVLETQLTNWRMHVVSAPSGQEALRLFKEEAFDIVLLDFQMPEMDGVTLAREIRRTSQVPLMLLSSSSEVMDGADALLFQSQILKPIKHSLLLAAMLKATGVKRSDTQVIAERLFDPGLAASHPLRVLLVEDNSINQKVGLRMLSQFGYQADLAKDGREALDQAGRGEYDLILMDIQMPEMGGIEASTLIRQQLKAGTPVIVALTAEALKGDRERFLGAGFDGYLSKPLQAKELREVLAAAAGKHGAKPAKPNP